MGEGACVSVTCHGYLTGALIGKCLRMSSMCIYPVTPWSKTDRSRRYSVQKEHEYSFTHLFLSERERGGIHNSLRDPSMAGGLSNLLLQERREGDEVGRHSTDRSRTDSVVDSEKQTLPPRFAMKRSR